MHSLMDSRASPQDLNESLYRASTYIDSETKTYKNDLQSSYKAKLRHLTDLDTENKEIKEWLKELKNQQFEYEFHMALDYEGYGRERMKELAYDLVIKCLSKYGNERFKEMKRVFTEKLKSFMAVKRKSQE